MSRQVKSTLAVVAARSLDNSFITHTRASSATRTNDIGLVEVVGSGDIRLDFDSSPTTAGRQLGWLLEEATTNTLLQSADFSTTWSQATAVQTNIGTVVTDNTVSPDGSQVADEIKAASAATGIVAVKQAGLTFTTDNWYTVSVYAKKGSNVDYLEISNKDDAASGMTFAQTFNLNTGATGASGGTVYSAKMKEHAGGWYRCSVTFQADASSNGSVYYKARNDNAVSTTGTFALGDGFYLWGAQVENVKYMTSYIPTTTATVARAADVMSVLDTDNKWNWDIGMSILMDARPLNSDEVVTPLYHYADTTNDNYMTLLSDGKYKIHTGGVSQLASDPLDTGSATVSGDNVINIAAMTTGRLHLAQNGVMCPSASLPDTSFSLPAKTNSSDYCIKFFHGTGFSQGSGHLQRFEIFSRQLSDNELANTSVRKFTEDKLFVSDQGAVADGSITAAQLAADCVIETRILDDAVTNAKIATGAVTATSIANNTITATQIAGDTITSTEIAENAIGQSELAPNSVTSAHIALDVIVAEDLAANSITVSELQDNAVTANKIINDAVITSKILDQNVTTAKIADGNVTSAKIGVGQINASHIADGTVVEAELADNAVTEVKILNGAVTETKIGALQVTNGKLANDSVTDTKLADHATLDASRAVGTNHIKDLNVTEGKIAANAVTEAKILDGAVTSDKIPAGTITASHIANGTIVESELANNSVTADKLADNAVDTAAIVDLNVTTAKIADLNVTRAKIAADAIDGTKIADDAIGAEHIADGAVTSAAIAAGALSGSDLANGAVDTSQLAADSVTDVILEDHATLDANRAVGANHIKDGAVTASKISAGTITAAHIADGTVVAAELADNSVEEAKIKDGAVTTDKIADNAITSAKIAFDVIVAQDIANNAITIAELADNSVDTAAIVDLNVTTGKIADLNVTEGKIADLAVTNGKLANNSVTAGKIAAGTITSSELGNNSVTGAHIAMGSDAGGDVLYYNGTDYIRLAKGTAGQTLVMNTGATAPEWGAPGSSYSQSNTNNTSFGGGILTGTIANAGIANNAITSAMIAPGVIVAQDLATNAVNGTHIALGSDIAGDIMYYNGTDYVRLPKGTASQVLAMNAGATAPEWAADSTNVSGTSLGGGVLTGTIGAANIANGVITVGMMSASGTASSTTFLRGDGAWAVPLQTAETDPTATAKAVTMAIALG